MLETLTLNAKFLEEPMFEVVEHARVRVSYVDQDDLSGAVDTGFRVEERTATIDDSHVIQALDMTERATVVGIDQTVDRTVEHLAVLPKPIFNGALCREEGTNKDRAVDGLQVRRTREEPLQDGADAPDLARRFMCDMHRDILLGHVRAPQDVCASSRVGITHLKYAP